MTQPNTKPLPTDTVEFIMDVHDAQMNAKDPTEAMFYRMHKEMAPTILTILEEMRDRSACHAEFVQESACFIEAFARFMASAVDATAGVLGGSGPARMEARVAIAGLIVEGMNLYLKKYLENDGEMSKSEEAESAGPHEGQPS
jgi:hypothetical protein